LAALLAMALAACAPVGADGYGNQPDTENAAAASTPEPAEEPEAEPSADPVAKQAPEDLTERLIGKKVARMGQVVTDEDGWILYRFDKDTADPPASNCYDECERVWPPSYTDGNPVVKGIDEDLVGTVTRDDGTRQLTINGWPVYRYIGDKKPGQWSGQAVGGVWFVISPNGKKNLTCLPKGTPKAVPAPPAEEDEKSGEAGGSGDAGGDEAPADSGYSY
jgi:predicted lipoprotein with Yx(FWY)xxD motif